MDFRTGFANHAQTVLATPEGRQFSAADFAFSHTGGGFTAWMRPIGAPDADGWHTGHHLTITDSSGADACLTVADDGGPDYWLVGAYGGDGGWVQPRKAATVAEALAIADEIDRLVRAKDWIELDGEMADLPLAETPRHV